jgi:hypothetical protein
MRLLTHFSALSAAGAALLVALAAASVAPVPAAAQTAEQACSGDAQRLCGQFIPDRQKTGACMARQVRSLSPACAAFFKSSKSGKSGRRSSRHKRHH